MVLPSAFLAFAPLGQAEKAETKKLSLPEIRKIEKSSLPLNLKLPTLKELSLDTLEVSPLAAQQIKTNPVGPPPAEPPRHLPKWERLELNHKLRFVPVISDGKRAYASLYGGYGDEFSFSQEFERKLKEAYHARTQKDSSAVRGEIVQAAFAEAKIHAEENVFWFLFHSPKEQRRRIKDISHLLVYPNEVGDGIFGTLGIELGPAPRGARAGAVLGLAFLGKESLLNPSPAFAPSWRTVNMGISSDQALAHVNSLHPVIAPDLRELKQPLEFRVVNVGSFELLEARAEFQHKPGEQVHSPSEHLFGYFLRGNGEMRALFDFYLDGDYFQAPEQILVGDWVKGYDETLYISSTGMGDCGLFVLVKAKAGERPVALPVRCGSWGC